MTRRAELQSIAQEGKRIRTTFLEVRFIASPFVRLPGMRTRVGLIVPRFRQSAVARNRLKRRLRELSRRQILPMDVAVDVVIRIRPEAYRAPFASLATEIDRVILQLEQWQLSEPEPGAASLDHSTGHLSNDT